MLTEHGFDSLDNARVWVNGFVHWYNAEHKHSGLNFVTPNERHTLKDGDILGVTPEFGENSTLRNLVEYF